MVVKIKTPIIHYYYIVIINFTQVLQLHQLYFIFFRSKLIWSSESHVITNHLMFAAQSKEDDDPKQKNTT